MTSVTSTRDVASRFQKKTTGGQAYHLIQSAPPRGRHACRGRHTAIPAHSGTRQKELNMVWKKFLHAFAAVWQIILFMTGPVENTEEPVLKPNFGDRWHMRR